MVEAGQRSGALLTSNYACSDQMPEKVLDCLDYHSADVTHQLTERLTVRCFAGLGNGYDQVIL